MKVLSIVGLIVALFAVVYAQPLSGQWDSQMKSFDTSKKELDSLLPHSRHRREEDKKNKFTAYSQFRNGRHESSNLDYERKFYDKGDTKVSVYAGAEHRPGHGVGGHTGLRVSF